MRDYFAFFKFYYYLVKRSPKKYDILTFRNNSHLIVLITPLLFTIAWMFVFIFAGVQDIMWPNTFFMLSAFSVPVNLMIVNHVYDEGRRIQRDLEDQRRQMKYDEMRRAAEQRAREERRRMEEEMRRTQETFERWKRAKEQHRYHTGQQQTSQSSTTDRLRQCYSILGIQPTRDTEIIRKAYRSMAKKHHPDMGGNQQKFIELKSAYDLLMKAVQVTARKV